jgi:hypothetical protein
VSRSVTSASPPGRNAIAHGTESPVARSRGTPARATWAAGAEEADEDEDEDDDNGGGVDPPACVGDPPDEQPARPRAPTTTSVLSLTLVKFPSQSGTSFPGRH